MALNFSSRPIFPSRMYDDAMLLPIRLGDGLIVNEGDAENACPCRGGDYYCTCSSEGCSQDSDGFYFLPADPFGMDISSTFTAITGWLEDMEMNSVSYVGDVDWGVYPFFAGLNPLWNNATAMKFQPFPAFASGSSFFNRCSSPYDVYPNYAGGRSRYEDMGSCSVAGISGCKINFGEAGDASFFDSSLGLGSLYRGSYDCVDSRSLPSYVGLGSRSASHVSFRSFGDSVGCWKQNDALDVLPAVNNNVPEDCFAKRGNYGIEVSSCFKNSSDGCSAGGDGTPHYALYLSLDYLGLRELLSIEMVCKSLHSTVRTEKSLWRSLHVHQPLDKKITDEILMRLADRAEGKLECLRLVECPGITADGLRHVIRRNPKLRKLSIPGCIRLRLHHVLESMRTLKLLGTLQLKHVRVGGLYGVTEEQFDELKLLLGVEGEKRLGDHKPYYRQIGNMYLPCQDSRVIDIEMCPMCQQPRLVYDCPDEACMVKEAASQVCRGCILCISRCIQCGRCTTNTRYEEIFSFEIICSHCYNPESMINPLISLRNVSPPNVGIARCC